MSATLYYPPHHDPCYEAIVSEISHYLFSSSNHLLHSPLSVSRYGSGGPPSSEHVALMKNVIKARGEGEGEGGGVECLDSLLGGSVAAEKASQPPSARPLPCKGVLPPGESSSSLSAERPHASAASTSSSFTPSSGGGQTAPSADYPPQLQHTYYNSNEPLAAAVQRHHEWICKSIVKHFGLTRSGPAVVVDLPISVEKEEPTVDPDPPNSPGSYSCVIIKRVLRPTRATATALLILLASNTNAFEAVRLLVEYCGADVYGRYTTDACARHSGDERYELASSRTKRSDPVGEGEEGKGVEKKNSDYENDHDDATLSLDASAPRPKKEIGGAYIEYSYNFEKGVLTKTESFAFYPDTNKWLSDKRRQFAKNKGHDGIDMEDDNATETPSNENARQPVDGSTEAASSCSSPALAYPTTLHFAAKAGRAEMCILLIALASIHLQAEHQSLPPGYEGDSPHGSVATLSTATKAQATVDTIRNFIVPPFRLYYYHYSYYSGATPTCTLEKESSSLPSSSASISTITAAVVTVATTPPPLPTQQRLLTRLVESASEGSTQAPPSPTVPSDSIGSTTVVVRDNENINFVVVKALLLSTPTSIHFLCMATSSGRTPLHYAARSGGGRVAAALSVAFRSSVVTPEKSSLCEERADHANVGGAPSPHGDDDDDNEGDVYDAENATTAGPFLSNYLFVDVNVRDSMQGSTPLHEACLQGRLGMIKLLLQLGEEAPESEVLGLPHLTTRCCSSGISHIPIKSATAVCAAQIVLTPPPLWLKASAGIPDVQGNTALHLACRVLRGPAASESTLFESLISSAVSTYSFYGDDGRDVTTTSAVGHNDEDTAPTTRADRSKKNENEQSSSTGTLRNVRLCVGRGLGINAKTKAQYSPLHTAVCFGNVEAVRALLEFRKGGCGECHGGILHHPALVVSETEGRQEKGNTNCPRCRCDVNAVAVLRRTALHLACVDRYPTVEIIKLLLEHGASVSVVDAKGLTPLQCALRFVRSMPPPTHTPDGDTMSSPAPSVFSLLADYGAT